MADLNKHTLFDLAERQMFDQVRAKVRTDLVEQYLDQIRPSLERVVEERLVQYATSEIKHMTDHLGMREEFVIWLKRNEGELEEMHPAPHREDRE